MIWEVLILGFVLSLDNFRVSIALGTVPFGLKRAMQVALTFGLWDAIMPLIGLLIGRKIGDGRRGRRRAGGRPRARRVRPLPRHLGPSESRAGGA